ncbi:GNAT family N-acetyltransferase [Deinococcus deserti]|uniref:Putative GCN5-related N-acetyltransferase n=1 Tax=Deinococcus deserti (strain DSM 17065 / CIP 109153 / LMG 22923 / VCD115) TaxID=546414 RepID=C1CY38_DEIDV|nr:GNAT family N-acetyltransferase [Deinococcus deserti]ACO46994.1 putative GCN5-related N-acetyltransferase [Deinococcus deserti VCD115]
MALTTLPFVLRVVRAPDDFSAIAEVRSASNPDWPVSAEQIGREHANRDPKLYFTELVAEQQGRIVGVGSVGHDDFSFEEWRYWGGLGVHPDARGQGVGSALYTELLRRVQERGAREVRTMLSDQPHDAPGRAFLERRGFRVVWERFESRLHTAEAPLGAFDALLARMEADGVRLVSIAELAGDPQRDRRLYELDWRLFQDVPMGSVLTRRSFETWVKEELQDPDMRLDLSFVAVREGVDDPLTGPYVGYTSLGWNAGGFYYIGMTGVRREDRGRGVAKALKLASMRALQASGGGLIRTFNDAPNRAMLSMNSQLGFKRTATRYRYELRLDAEVKEEPQ